MTIGKSSETYIGQAGFIKPTAIIPAILPLMTYIKGMESFGKFLFFC
jgi:hypothetical protein